MDEEMRSPARIITDEEKKLMEERRKQQARKKSQMAAIVKAPVEKKDPEEKMYLLVYGFYDEYDITDSDGVAEHCIGRTATFYKVKEIIEMESVDIHNSYVLAETVQLQNRLSFYDFMVLMLSRYFQDEDFDIEKYNTGDPSGESEAELYR